MTAETSTFMQILLKLNMSDTDRLGPFEGHHCPDEILLMIVKLSSQKHCGEYDQDFLYHTIGRVSKQFNKMAHDVTLWKSGRLM